MALAYNSNDETNFTMALSQLEWPNFNSLFNVDYALNEFYHLFMKTFLLCFPKTKPRKGKMGKKPWIDFKLLQRIEEKSRLSHKYKRNPNSIHKEALKISRNRLSNLLCKAKRWYYNLKLARSRSSSENWKIVKEITQPNRVGWSIALINNGGELLCEKSEIANAFKQFFVSLGLKLSESLVSLKSLINCHINFNPCICL